LNLEVDGLAFDVAKLFQSVAKALQATKAFSTSGMGAGRYHSFGRTHNTHTHSAEADVARTRRQKRARS